MPTSTLLFAGLSLFFALVAIYTVVRLHAAQEDQEAAEFDLLLYRSTLKTLDTKTAQYRKALLFYANEDNWKHATQQDYPFLRPTPIAKDQGQKARDQFPEFQWSE